LKEKSNIGVENLQQPFHPCLDDSRSRANEPRNLLLQFEIDGLIDVDVAIDGSGG